MKLAMVFIKTLVQVFVILSVHVRLFPSPARL